MENKCPYTLGAHHIGIFCHDMQTSIDWWREHFNMRERRKRVNPLPDHGNSYMSQCRLGGVYLELYDFKDIPHQTEDNYWNTWGTKHVCFYVKNRSLDEVQAYFDAKGIKYEDSTEILMGDDGKSVRQLWFYDPDGTRIQIIDNNFFPGGDFGERSDFELFRTKSQRDDIPQLVMHHVAMYCRSLDESIPWMEERIDLKCVWTGTEIGNDGKAYRVAFLKGFGYYAELHERPGLKPQPPEAYWGTLGTKHISLYTAEKDMNPLMDYLESKGCVFNVRHHWAQEYNCIPGGYHVGFFPSPEGTTIEVNGTFWPGEGLYPGETIFDD